MANKSLAIAKPARRRRRRKPVAVPPLSALGAERHEGSAGGVLGLTATPISRLVARLERGFPYKLVEAFQEATDLSAQAVADLMRVPSRTLNRRKREGRLHTDESERLFRAARVVDGAIELFEGDVAGARRWLKSPQPALGGATPLAFARTDVGAREVEDLIGRLEHGVLV